MIPHRCEPWSGQAMLQAGGAGRKGTHFVRQREVKSGETERANLHFIISHLKAHSLTPHILATLNSAILKRRQEQPWILLRIAQFRRQ